jgi:type II secretion system protein H
MLAPSCHPKRKMPFLQPFRLLILIYALLAQELLIKKQEYNMQKKQKGFSVVELLLVLLVVGLLASMAINISVRGKYRWALRGMAREITSTFYQAKQLASRENSPTMLSFTSTSYSYSRRRSGAWVQISSEKFGDKITATKTPTSSAGFAISPSGFLLNPDTMGIYGLQTIVLSAPHGSQFDTITINIYPYGGVRVQKDFK